MDQLPLAPEVIQGTNAMWPAHVAVGVLALAGRRQQRMKLMTLTTKFGLTSFACRYIPLPSIRGVQVPFLPPLVVVSLGGTADLLKDLTPTPLILLRAITQAQVPKGPRENPKGKEYNLQGVSNHTKNSKILPVYIDTNLEWIPRNIKSGWKEYKVGLS